jgi:hypothetical protein
MLSVLSVFKVIAHELLLPRGKGSLSTGRESHCRAPENERNEAEFQITDHC